MIWIFNLERASAGVCDNYTDVFQYIHSLENQQTTKVSKQKKNDLEILCSSSEADLKHWCINFCKNHNYVIIETPSQAVNSEHSPWNANSHSITEERFKQAS